MFPERSAGAPRFVEACSTVYGVKTPESETLLWAYFLWLVVKEAPEAIGYYLDLWERFEARRAKAAEPTQAFLRLAPARGTSSAELTLTTGGEEAGVQALLNSMAELDPDFPQF